MEDEERERRRRRVRQLLILLPFLIASLVIGGAFLGFFIAALTGYSGFILAMAFSTAGFALSIWLSILIAESVMGERGRK